MMSFFASSRRRSDPGASRSASAGPAAARRPVLLLLGSLYWRPATFALFADNLRFRFSKECGPRPRDEGRLTPTSAPSMSTSQDPLSTTPPARLTTRSLRLHTRSPVPPIPGMTIQHPAWEDSTTELSVERRGVSPRRMRSGNEVARPRRALKRSGVPGAEPE